MEFPTAGTVDRLTETTHRSRPPPRSGHGGQESDWPRDHPPVASQLGGLTVHPLFAPPVVQKLRRHELPTCRLLGPLRIALVLLDDRAPVGRHRNDLKVIAPLPFWHDPEANPGAAEGQLGLEFEVRSPAAGCPTAPTTWRCGSQTGQVRSAAPGPEPKPPISPTFTLAQRP
jgi:hypothetical protein